LKFIAGGLLSFLLLAACGEADDSQAVRDMSVKGGMYNFYLHQRYVNLADRRQDISDPPGFKHFIAKARAAALAKKVSPDALDDTTVPQPLQSPFTAARWDVVSLIERGTMLHFPDETAEVLVLIDCWLWQARMEEELTCRKSFKTALKNLADHRKTLTVVLLGNSDGSVGAVEVDNKQGRQMLTRVGEATQLSAADPAPSPTFVLDAKEIQEQFLESLEAHPTPPTKFILYFEQNSSELTGESRARLPAIINEISNRTIVDISIIGHTDRVSTAEYNRALSLKRTRRVINSLVSQGVDAGLIHTSSHGENNPLIPTADNVAEPRNRRVEVIVQ
jgi:outer membrane protein OmpA-like peptidoglycan-associated protein